MSKYLLAHDLGTSGNKATLFTTDGALIRSCVSEYPTRYYNGNWAEQNPENWWKAVCVSTTKLTQNIDPADIGAVAFGGQMMGCLCVDEKGVPLYNSIIWADMRAQAEEKHIVEKIGAREFFQTVGHRPGASYTLAKYLWLKKHLPIYLAKLIRFCKLKTTWYTNLQVVSVQTFLMPQVRMPLISLPSSGRTRFWMRCLYLVKSFLMLWKALVSWAKSQVLPQKNVA